MGSFGGVGIHLNPFNIVFCPLLEKWVDIPNCHFCNCRQYPGHDFRCDAADAGYESNDSRPYIMSRESAVTTKELIEILKGEEERVLQKDVKRIRKEEIKIRKQKGSK